MNIEIKINEDIKAAMLARDTKKLEALRAIKAAMLLEKTKGAIVEIPKEVELSILQKLVKQRKDSATIFKEQNREDLAEVETFQAEIIEAYLPKQLSKEEMEQVIAEVIEQTGASGMKDMGKVMGMASKKMAGKADNKIVAEIVKAMLLS